MLAASATSGSRRRGSIGDMPKVIADALKNSVRELLLDENNTVLDVEQIADELGLSVSASTVSSLSRQLGTASGRGRKGKQHRQHERWSPNRQHALDARDALPLGSFQALADWIREQRGVEITRQQVAYLLATDGD